MTTPRGSMIHDGSSDIPSFEVRINGFFNDRSEEQMEALLDEFYRDTGIQPNPIFMKGMHLAKNPHAFSNGPQHNLDLSPEERYALELDSEPQKTPSSRKRRFIPHIQRNNLNKWHNLPWQLWKLVILCAVGATVQGWDEAAINGAQSWYQDAFRIYIKRPGDVDDVKGGALQVGLVNAAPYLCCVASALLTPWLNKRLGRRGTIFWCAMFSIFFAFAQAFAQTWQQLFVYRLLMGLGIGPKSATVPIYAAECAPANIRGSLVMLWQVWTALGIMAGCISGVVLQHLGNRDTGRACEHLNAEQLRSWSCSENWRLILASPAILPIALAAYIYTCFESPRWTIRKAHALRIAGRLKGSQILYRKAFRALEEMSRDPLLAARDMFSQYHLLAREQQEVVQRQETMPGRSQLAFEIHELFFIRRNGRAVLAALVCLFAQQFCGINFIIYYSSFIFQEIKTPTPGAPSAADTAAAISDTLLYTMGIGILNLLFAVPAFFTIDTVGRRTLLLTTFPFLAFFNMLTAVACAVGPGHYPMALVAMYLFVVFYSVGEGPVPFVYASESMPLHIRETGMAFVVSINWLFNWLIAFSGAEFIADLQPVGTFWFYSGWCVLLWFAVLFLVPETRLLTLEELDYVFGEISMWYFARHAWQSFLWRVHFVGKRPPGLYDESEAQYRERRRTTDDFIAPHRVPADTVTISQHGGPS